MRHVLILVAALASAPGLAADRVPPAAQRAAPDAAIACPQHGPGFVQIPGTTSCVRIGGRVSSAYTASARPGLRENLSGSSTQGRVAIDTRTDTAYGPLRSYVRVRAGQDSLTGR